MRVVDDALVARFAGKKRCEWCGKVKKCDPHHVWTRGAGRVDVRTNLVSLCRKDHNAFHAGVIKRAALVAIVAQREGCTPEDAEAVVRFFRGLQAGHSSGWMRERCVFAEWFLGCPVGWKMALMIIDTMPDQSRPRCLLRKRKNPKRKESNAHTDS